MLAAPRILRPNNPTRALPAQRQAGWAGRLVLCLLAVVGCLAMGLIAVGVATYAPGGDAGGTPLPGDTNAAVVRAGSAQVVLAPALQQTYDRSCGICHSRAGTGAPRAGDMEAWQPRLAVGLPTLLDRTLEGYKTMPPMGLCMDCSRDDFTQLIAYMAQIDADEACAE